MEISKHYKSGSFSFSLREPMVKYLPAQHFMADINREVEIKIM